MLCASTGEVMNIDGFGNDKVRFFLSKNCQKQSITMFLQCIVCILS